MATEKRPNIVLITADDMNWDAVGAYGCPVVGTTPNIDRLAAGGMRFNYAHVTIAVCQPSRSALMTGRYPHNSGGEGFFHLRKPGVPILPDMLRSAGYRVGILGKLTHSTPYADFAWDMSYDMPELGMGRNPDVYYRHTKAFVQDAVTNDRPFFLMANSHDPHRPFYGNDRKEWYENAKPPAVSPSKTFDPDEVVTPGFLADLPEVRLEISEYYNSVRRCDDTVGKIMQAIKEAGAEDNTLIMFLSDNGMAFPFAKTNCYLNSTRTPWIARWPGRIAPGSVERAHFISGVDFTPTALDAAGADLPPGVDGFSFLPVLLGQNRKDRETVFTQFHQTAARRNYPMRCVQSRRFGYIFNAWSDGEYEFLNESQSGRTWKAMLDAAADDPKIAERTTLFSYRALEEFYDFENDPNGLKNLIDDPAYADEIDKLREELETRMERTGDPALEGFRNRTSREALNKLMEDTAKEIGRREE